MDARARTALVVCDELPLPNYAGHTTYNRAFVQALKEAGFNVDIFITGYRFRKPIFNSSEEVQIREIRTVAPHAFNPFGDQFWVRPLGLARLAFNSSGLKRRLQKRKPQEERAVHIGKWLTDRRIQRDLRGLIAQNRPDYLLVDTIFRSTVLDELSEQTTKVLIGHDVFHQRCEALIASGLSPSPNVSHADERRALGRFDGAIAITENDARSYRTMCPALPVLDLPSPITVRRSPPPRTDTQRILYIGSRAQVNVDGLEWFLDAIWPTVRQACPQARLDVVGSICTDIRDDIDGVVLHGRLDDFSVVADQAMFAVNPVRAGSGLKIKMLDYFAHGLGCLTTPAGALGFPESDRSPIGVCTSEKEYAHACVLWLTKLAQCQQQSEYATAYADQFSFESFSGKLIDWLAKLPHTE
jgi:hypothetical protein